jgi:hypothetical protein
MTNKRITCPNCKSEKVCGSYELQCVAEYMYWDEDRREVTYSDLQRPMDADVTESDLAFIVCDDCGHEWTARDEEDRHRENRVVIVQDWLESEAGGGQRPDGCSIHLSEEDCKAYIAASPREYSRECGDPYIGFVQLSTYKKLLEAVNIRKQAGLRLLQSSAHKVIKPTKTQMMELLQKEA